METKEAQYEVRYITRERDGWVWHQFPGSGNRQQVINLASEMIRHRCEPIIFPVGSHQHISPEAMR